MSFSVLGATVNMITKDLGIHNAAVDTAVKALQVTGDMIRSVNAIRIIYNEALVITNALQGENTADEVANAASKVGSIAATEAETAANYGLAASFEAINAAMGPIGWIALAGGLIAGAAIGYGAAGGFGGGAAAAGPTGAAGETTNIYMGNVSMQTRQDAEATATSLATIYHHKRRTRGG